MEQFTALPVRSKAQSTHSVTYVWLNLMTFLVWKTQRKPHTDLFARGPHISTDSPSSKMLIPSGRYQNCINLEFDVMPIWYRSYGAVILTANHTHQQKHKTRSQIAHKLKKTATRFGAKAPSSVSVQHTRASALMYSYVQSVILLRVCAWLVHVIGWRSVAWCMDNNFFEETTAFFRVTSSPTLTHSS
jgi:hypothetical protein